MMVGIPGSGKTTVAKQAAEHLNLEYICPDDIREELTGDAGDQSANNVVWQKAHELANEALETDRSVIIDATYTKEVDRRKDIALLREYGAQAVVGMFVDTHPDIAIQRRSGEHDRKVKPWVIQRMWKNLVENPPSVDDGFDEVMRIHPDTTN